MSSTDQVHAIADDVEVGQDLADLDKIADLDEIAAPAPVQNVSHATSDANESGEKSWPESGRNEDQSSDEEQELAGLDELEAPPPDENVDEASIYRHHDLESQRKSSHVEQVDDASHHEQTRSLRHRALSHFITCSFLIFFSILGTLARLGLSILTIYPGAPVSTSVLWANVSGSLIIGFLREDRMLFHHHYKKALRDAEASIQQESPITEPGQERKNSFNEQVEGAARKIFAERKTSLFLYVGLAVGFCGSLTSFGAFILDCFSALSNDLNTTPTSTYLTTSQLRSRPDGDSFMALLGILWIEITASLGALSLGAHLATTCERLVDRIPMLGFRIETALNVVIVISGWAFWIGSCLLTVWPPDDTWRGKVLFALVFAPPGCLLRFYLSKQFNRYITSFPLGTFTANVFGTCILAMAWDLQYSEVTTSVLGCQILQGIIEGFCGALTTVSTWVLELKGLRLKHAYLYAVMSIGLSLAAMTAIIGPLRWTAGFTSLRCVV